MWKIDTGKENILAIMQPYHHGIISMIIEAKTEVLTGALHVALKSEGFIISRASVINYCKLLAANDIISFKERPGKGGYHRVYAAKLTWEEIIAKIHNDIVSSLTNAFPDSIYLTILKHQ